MLELINVATAFAGTQVLQPTTLHFERGRMSLKCASCGHETPGWEISRARPALRFRGDARRYNPEELLVASLSSCHMLWYLHLCAEAGVNVLAYRDEAKGTMVEDRAKGGNFTQVTLHPKVTIAKGSDAAKARELHHAAHEKCYIANSVKTEIKVETQT